MTDPILARENRRIAQRLTGIYAQSGKGTMSGGGHSGSTSATLAWMATRAAVAYGEGQGGPVSGAAEGTGSDQGSDGDGSDDAADRRDRRPTDLATTTAARRPTSPGRDGGLSLSSRAESGRVRRSSKGPLPKALGFVRCAACGESLCAHDGVDPADPSTAADVAFRPCPSCDEAWYCDEACREVDWATGHRRQCRGRAKTTTAFTGPAHTPAIARERKREKKRK
jgi:hypothetical protein